MQKILLLMSILLSLAIIAEPSYAQEVKGKQLQKFAPDHWSKSKRHENLYTMTEAEDLPGLPAYSGKTKYLHGIMEPGENNKKNYQMSFLTQDDPQKVMDWYLSTLQANQWNILTSSSNGIVARNSNNNMCTISAGPSSQVINGQKYKSSLTVMYRLVPSQ